MSHLGEKIKSKITEVIAVAVAMVALLIVGNMAVAASIQANLRAGVVSAAALIEIYLLLWMVKQF